MIDRQKQRGFSLLEVLVAFAILSLSLGILFQIFSSGVRGTIVSERYNRALIIAESRLAEVGVIEHLTAGVDEGEAEKPFHWQIEVTPYQEDNPVSTSMRVKPYQIDVRVSWEEDGKARDLELSTLRLGTESQ